MLAKEQLLRCCLMASKLLLSAFLPHSLSVEVELENI